MSVARGRRALLVASIVTLTAVFPALAQDESTAPRRPPRSQRRVVAPPGVSPYQGAEPGSGRGLKIGYISLGDSIPFVNLVSQSLAEQAEIAGAEFVPCDSEVDAAKALACAQNLQGPGGRRAHQLPALRGCRRADLRGGPAGPGRVDRHPPAALRGRVHGRGQHACRHDPGRGGRPGHAGPVRLPVRRARADDGPRPPARSSSCARTARSRASRTSAASPSTSPSWTCLRSRSTRRARSSPTT